MPDGIKQKLINDFEIMKGIEESARQSYLKIAADKQITDEQVKDIFTKIANDELRHTRFVQQILEIIERDL